MATKIISISEFLSALSEPCISLPRVYTAIGGFVSGGHPEYLTHSIESAFLKGTPIRNLFLYYAAGQGDKKNRGINHLAHDGLTIGAIGGHWGLAPKLGEMALENRIIAYNIPQGVISKSFRSIASHELYVDTHVGLETFVDPYLEGGMINEMTRKYDKRDVVHHIKSRVGAGKTDLLRYFMRPLHIALLKGTIADYEGNVSLKREPFSPDTLAIAQAVYNSGGKVFVQVEEISEELLSRTEHPMGIIPGFLVSGVIMAPEEFCMQTFAEKYEPLFCSGERNMEAASKKLSIERRIIGARVLEELRQISGRNGRPICNLGIGMPEAVSVCAAEQGMLGRIVLSVEVGPNGGIAAGGLNFGAMYSPSSIIPQNSQFDFYQGSGLDFSALGMAETDAEGNINVSKFGKVLAGCGGFIDISQNTKNIVFVGTMTSGGLEIAIESGKLRILREGSHRKFARKVEQVTFSGKYARKTGQNVKYVTERCMFELGENGIELTEIAPGVDVGKDIQKQVDFELRLKKPASELVNPDYFKGC
ncbi:MAG: CoA-transferase [Nanoarchaeota archaeon]|nr:CoA-transferase [Nanoarchaeota archaeon]